MKILVDADACPVKDIILDLAKQRNLKVIWVVSLNHYSRREDPVQVVVVDALPQAVDIALINRVEPMDIVVTQDYGLAALVLGKKGKAISPAGYIFTERTMDSLLEKRHLRATARRAGFKIKGPRKRDLKDDQRFRRNLINLLDGE
ncbi:MAG TPA: YaiI/YqxD family protein [Candidatus Limnocylindrales bacterium]|nr:YaiI/YqxD family protein [Candidatus Limnocylindrales bacterium]